MCLAWITVQEICQKCGMQLPSRDEKNTNIGKSLKAQPQYLIVKLT
jgi:hypothetical protein